MIEADRLISAGTTLPEDVADRAIRPKLLEEYVGQPQVRCFDENLILKYLLPI